MRKLAGQRAPGNPWAPSAWRAIFGTMPVVSHRARLVDLTALLCILAGTITFLVAQARLSEIGRLSYRHPGPRTESALAAADRARFLAYAGVGGIVVGCIVAVTGALHLARRRAAEGPA